MESANEVRNLSKVFFEEYIVKNESNVITELHTFDDSVYIDGKKIDALLICDDHFYLVLKDGTELYFLNYNAPKTISL